MKRIMLPSFMCVSILLAVFACNFATAKKTTEPIEPTTVPVTTPKPVTPPSVASKDVPKVQVAILLDTSGSMDGLLNQAQSYLWNIVNTITALKYKEQTPRVEISLYEYGGYQIRNEDYVRQITPLTTNLDLISEQLFALTANGSIENCGTVIDHATRHLEWGDGKADMKLIYIAGNEEFTQGRIYYGTAIANALKNDIYVNTIHCGDLRQGIRDLWKDAALKGKGKFFNIDADREVRYIETPYDDQISECNIRLNNTYISYGKKGSEMAEMQIVQDLNAESKSKGVSAERTLIKSKKAYDNSSWDLVDKAAENLAAVEEIDIRYLDEELQNKSTEEIKKVVEEKSKERKAIQAEISELAKKRQAYIDAELKKQENNEGDDLGNAIRESLMTFANEKGYKVSL